MHYTIGFNESKTLKEGKTYYYIIDTLKDARYGPFEEKKDFIIQKSKLGIKLNL